MSLYATSDELPAGGLPVLHLQEDLVGYAVSRKYGGWLDGDSEFLSLNVDSLLLFHLADDQPSHSSRWVRRRAPNKAG